MKARTALPFLLAASVLLNIVLLARRPAVEPPAPRPAPLRPGKKEADSFLPPPEPARVGALEARVRELEAEKAVLAQPVAVAGPDRKAVFRDKLARVMKLWRDPRGLATAPPETLFELQEVSLEFQKAKIGRWKDPKAYADLIGAVLEQAAVEAKTPLNEAQRDALRRALDDYAVSLAGMEDTDAWQRYLHEAGPEAEVLQRLKTYVPPELEAKVMALGGMTPWTPSHAAWVDKGQAEAYVTQTWMSTYGLDESQKAAVQAAARVYANAMDALNAQMGAEAVPGRESAEWRRRTAQILVDVLSNLESALTPEQRERLRSRRPAEVRIYDPAAQRFGR